jgi:transcriptional antiterminator NusG
MVDEMSEDNGSQMVNEQSDLGQEAVEEAMSEDSTDAPETVETVDATENSPVAEGSSAEPADETEENQATDSVPEAVAEVESQETVEEAETVMADDSVVEPEIEAEDASTEITQEMPEDQADESDPDAAEDDMQEVATEVDEQAETPGQEKEVQEPVLETVQEEVATSESSVDDVPIDGQPAAPREPDDGRAWYVLHCYSGYENKVRHNLEQRIDSMGMKDRIFDVVVPTEEEIEVKEGKRRTVERRVFPGYILVNMVLSEESWYVVRNTPGVTSFVGQGNEPLPLRPEEVSQIIKRMEADAPRIKVTFKQGERVRIVDGPFNDFRGTVDEIDMERAKVRVMVNFFGRETPVELDFLQVEKA